MKRWTLNLFGLAAAASMSAVTAAPLTNLLVRIQANTFPTSWVKHHDKIKITDQQWGWLKRTYRLNADAGQNSFPFFNHDLQVSVASLIPYTVPDALCSYNHTSAAKVVYIAYHQVRIAPGQGDYLMCHYQ